MSNTEEVRSSLLMDTGPARQSWPRQPSGASSTRQPVISTHSPTLLPLIGKALSDAQSDHFRGAPSMGADRLRNGDVHSRRRHIVIHAVTTGTSRLAGRDQIGVYV